MAISGPPPSLFRPPSIRRLANDDEIRGKMEELWAVHAISFAKADNHRAMYSPIQTFAVFLFLSLPLGIPHGALVRKLSRKSRSKRLAAGNVSATWPSVTETSCATATAAARRATEALLLPMASTLGKEKEVPSG